MPNLHKTQLLHNADKVLTDLAEVEHREDIQQGKNKLAESLNKKELDLALFQHPDLPRYALLAYQDNLISHEQTISMLLRWAAFNDYSTDMKDVVLHKLDINNKEGRKELEKFLRTKASGIIMHSSMKVFDSISDEKLEAIYKDLTKKSVPSSEQSFITFTLPKKKLAEIIIALENTNYGLFLPIEVGYKNVSVIVPSFTLIQTVINHAGLRPINMISRIGDDDFDDVYSMHNEGFHPFGLSHPLYPKKVADGNKTGDYGFPIHDIYHTYLLANFPYPEVMKMLVNTGKKLIKDPEMDKNYQEFIEILIDNEFREWTIIDIFEKQLPQSDVKVLKSPEMGMFYSFKILFERQKTNKNLYDSIAKQIGEIKNYLEKYKNEDPENFKELLEKQQELNELLEKNPDLQRFSEEKYQTDLQYFVSTLINKTCVDSDKLEKVGLSFARLMCLLHPNNTAISGFAQLIKDSEQFLQTPYDQSKVFDNFVSYFRTQLFETTYPENHEIAKYQIFCKKLTDSVIENKVDLCKKLLKSPEYKRYIIDIDAVANNQIPLTQNAINLNNIGVVKLLFAQEGIDPSRYSLHQAAKNKNYELVAFLLEKGLDPAKEDENRLSAVHYSLVEGDVKLLKLFLEKVTIGENYFDYMRGKDIKIHANCEPLIKAYHEFKGKLAKFEKAPTEQRMEMLKEIINNNPENFSYNTSTDSDDRFFYQSTLFHFISDGINKPFIKSLNKEELEVLNSLTQKQETHVTKQGIFKEPKQGGLTESKLSEEAKINPNQ